MRRYKPKPFGPFRYFKSAPEVIAAAVPLYIRFPLSLRKVEMIYLWRAVDHDGEILESYITKTRDKAAAPAFMKKALKRHGSPERIVTDGLRSYGAAMDELGNRGKQEIGRHANNRVENSHLPFRQRERAMLRFRRMKTLQKFASVHANISNHFNLERHIVDRQTYKQRRSAAQGEWQSLVS